METRSQHPDQVAGTRRARRSAERVRSGEASVDGLVDGPVDVDVVVVGAGQAGLSAAYHLMRAGLVPVGEPGWESAGATFVVLDENPRAGGAWQHRWDSLTMADAHAVHDLPGMPLLAPDPREPANRAVPHYYAQYEEAYGLRVQRPVRVDRVEDDAGDTGDTGERADVGRGAGGARTNAAHAGAVGAGMAGAGAVGAGMVGAGAVSAGMADARRAGRSGRLLVRSRLVGRPDEVVTWRARGLVNASGTWDKPFWPAYPGRGAFRGRQLHTHDFRTADELADGHVVVVGGGTSAVQLTLQIARVTTTTWVTRRPPAWRDVQFSPEIGRDAVALVDARTRAGLAPESVVAVTGLPLAPLYREGIEAGVLRARPMFSRIVAEGVVWDEPALPVPAARLGGSEGPGRSEGFGGAGGSGGSGGLSVVGGGPGGPAGLPVVDGGGPGGPAGLPVVDGGGAGGPGGSGGPVTLAEVGGGWVDGPGFVAARTILWCTGFRASLDHLAPLRLRGPGGGIVMDGTQVVADPRIQLVGYGPSASTIGANRAGREAVRNLRRTLGF